MRAVASRMRATKRRASSGSSSALSSKTSALARMAATGFLSSCDRSEAKVSTNGRPSRSRRIESIARVRRVTSRPNAIGGAPRRSPKLTRSPNTLSASIGAAIARPIQAAASAAAVPKTRLMTSTVGAKSASRLRMPTVGLTTRTAPTRTPRTRIGASTETTPCSSSGACIGEQTRAAVVEQHQPQIRAAPALVLEPSRQVDDADAGAVELTGHHAGQGHRFVFCGLRSDAHGARLDAIDHHQAQAERERADDHGQGQEDLHADRHAARARAQQTRDHERHEQHQPDRGGRDDNQANHGSFKALGASVTR